MIPFTTQYEKLVKAYMGNKVRPMDACACFVGNLLNGTGHWFTFKESVSYFVHEDELHRAAFYLDADSEGSYTPKEILQMEGLFMRTWKRYGRNEESLFRAFEVTIALLRKIHENKGEVIGDYVFKKRNLTLTKTLKPQPL